MLRGNANGRLGTAVATDSNDAVNLVENGVESAIRGELLSFNFATEKIKTDDSFYSKETEDLKGSKLIDLCEQSKEAILTELPDIALNISVERSLSSRKVETKNNGGVKYRTSAVSFNLSAPIKGAGTRIGCSKSEIDPYDYPKDRVDEFIKRYRWTKNVKTPKTKRMPVLWAPESLFIFGLAIGSGLSGEELNKGTSPLLNSEGKLIFDEKLTIMDDPLLRRVGARPFDDEGTQCQKRALVNNGVLESYLLDLRTAEKLGRRSTGNGIKSKLFMSGIDIAPNPWPETMLIATGESTMDGMIKSVDEGILLTSGMGFHSSNYPQGQMSIQAVGFMIENGEVTGRLDSTMLAGNIYEDFKNIRSISNKLEPSWFGYYPGILVDSMQIIGR